MSRLSKVLPEVREMPCKALAHPWTDSCLLSAVHSLANSCLGAAGFYALLYLCQYMSMVAKKKKTKKGALKEFLRMHLRSTIFGASVTAGTFASHCLIRRLLGRYHYCTLVFIPACVGGCFVFLESRKGQELCTNAFANCTLELWLTLLERSGALRWTPNVQTFLFMALSSFLSSLLGSTDFDSNYFWFFMPPKVKKSEKAEGVCFHEGGCGRHIFDLLVMYSATGLALQFLRLFTKNLRNPRKFFVLLVKPKAYRLAAFLGGYVFLYQAIRCYLYRKCKKYSIIHDSLAGFLAGVAFRFQPTIPILNSAVITTVQVLAEASYRRKMLPNLPYLEMIFVLLCGVLFHSRILLGEHCPQLLVYVISAVTHGTADAVAVNYKNIRKKILESG